MTAHWGVPDPAAVEGSETEKWVAFRSTFRRSTTASRSLRAFRSRRLIAIKLQERLDAIGKERRQPEPA